MTAAADNNVKPIIDAPPSSITSNPQQGMVEDPRVLAGGSVKGPTPPPLAPCSPLTISSALEQQPAPTTATPTAVAANVPVAVVGGPLMEATTPSAPNNNMAATNAVPSPEEKRWKRTPPTEFDSRKLFVGGLPTNVNDEQFLCFFEQFGEVIDSVVMVDRSTKRSRGFGFVTFASQEVTKSLLNNVPGKTGIIDIFGKGCEVKACEPKIDDGRYSNNTGNNSNSGGGGKKMVQPFNKQYHRVTMQNHYNRGNGYNGDERDFDVVHNHFEPNNQGYYNHGYQNHPNMMMYHHPYGYPQYQNTGQNYPSNNYPSYDGANYDRGGGEGAQYSNYYASAGGYYSNHQEHFAGHYHGGNHPMYSGVMGSGEGGEGVPQQAQQQHSNYGGYYPQDPMNHAQFSDGGGSVGSSSYEAQVYPATTSGVDGDYGTGDT